VRRALRRTTRLDSGRRTLSNVRRVRYLAWMSTADADPGARDRVRGHMALVVVQFCFGLFPIFGKWAFLPGGFSALSVAAWRMVVGALILSVLAIAVHKKSFLPRLVDLPILLLGSLLGVTLNMGLYLEGLHRSTPTNAALMMGLIPVFTFAIAAIVKQEELRASRILGVVLALAGASMLFWAERPELAREHAFGNLLMAANALCYSGYFVVSRPLLRRYPPLVVIAWVFLLSVPAVPFLAHGETLVPADAPPIAWRALGFILVFPTVLAYLLNIFALSKLRASTTAIYVYVQPLITATASWIFFREELTPGMLWAAVLVFPGIWLVARRPKPASTALAHGNAPST
jgi:drug/metabolite transporter (DMT)-like permease